MSGKAAGAEVCRQRAGTWEETLTCHTPSLPSTSPSGLHCLLSASLCHRARSSAPRPPADAPADTDPIFICSQCERLFTWKCPRQLPWLLHMRHGSEEDPLGLFLCIPLIVLSLKNIQMPIIIVNTWFQTLASSTPSKSAWLPWPGASRGPYPGVRADVHLQPVVLAEALLAVRALVGALACGRRREGSASEHTDAVQAVLSSSSSRTLIGPHCAPCPLGPNHRGGQRAELPSVGRDPAPGPGRPQRPAAIPAQA